MASEIFRAYSDVNGVVLKRPAYAMSVSKSQIKFLFSSEGCREKNYVERMTMLKPAPAEWN